MKLFLMLSISSDSNMCEHDGYNRFAAGASNNLNTGRYYGCAHVFVCLLNLTIKTKYQQQDHLSADQHHHQKSSCHTLF